MSRKIFVFLSISFLLLASCKNSNNSKDTAELKIIYGKSVNAPFKFSEMCDTVFYVPIQSQALIGHIDEIKYVNNTFFLCSKNDGKIFLVTKDGDIKKVICKLGHAKDEYVHLADFDISSKDEHIYIYDDANKRFQVYSNNGSFLYSFETENVIRDFAVLDNGNCLMYTPDYIPKVKRGLWLTDNHGKFKKQLVTIDDDFRYGGIFPNYLVHIDAGTVGLMGGEDHDNIYHISDDQIQTSYHLNLNLKIPNDLKSKEFVDYDKYKGKIYVKNSYFESSRWLMFNVMDMESGMTCIYDKNKKVLHQLVKESDFVDDMSVIINGFQSCGELMISIIEPDYILAFDEYKAKFPHVTKESNPILCVAKCTK